MPSLGKLKYRPLGSSVWSSVPEGGSPSNCVCDVACSVYLEEGFDEETVAELRRKGHDVHANESHHARVHFGRGQIIRRNPDSGVLWGGSDPRADGQVIGW